MNIQGLLPAITSPLLSQSARPAATSSAKSNSSTSPGNGTSATSLQDTFLNLLVTELQNQDPTAPVDPTQMVGQLVSLNQLDQLIAINSTLSSLTGGDGGGEQCAGNQGDGAERAGRGNDSSGSGHDAWGRSKLGIGGRDGAATTATGRRQGRQHKFAHEPVRQHEHTCPERNLLTNRRQLDVIVCDPTLRLGSLV